MKTFMLSSSVTGLFATMLTEVRKKKNNHSLAALTLRAGSDLNRDRQVNEVDYNLWLTERYRSA